MQPVSRRGIRCAGLVAEDSDVIGSWKTIAISRPMIRRRSRLDILAYEVAAIRGEAAMEPMRRIKYQLVNTRDGDDSKPLGD